MCRAHWELRGITVKLKTTLLLIIERYSIRTRVLEVVGARLRPLDTTTLQFSVCKRGFSFQFSRLQLNLSVKTILRHIMTTDIMRLYMCHTYSAITLTLFFSTLIQVQEILAVASSDIT